MSIQTFGGGDRVAPLGETSKVTFAVMVNVELRSEDREQTVARPLYEYPLLKRLYMSLGGSAKLDASWLVTKEGREAHPRHVDLTKDMLRAETARLQREFRRPVNGGGWHSFFKQVYGEGEGSTFYQAVSKLARGYNDLVKRAAMEKRLITIDEWNDLANSIEPKTPDIDAVDLIELTEVTVQAPIDMPDEIDDPIAEMQNYLDTKGWSPDVALAVATQHSNGRVDAGTLKQIPELGQKPDKIRQLYDDYKAWRDKPVAKVEAKPDLAIAE